MPKKKKNKDKQHAIIQHTWKHKLTFENNSKTSYLGGEDYGENSYLFSFIIEVIFWLFTPSNQVPQLCVLSNRNKVKGVLGKT